MSWKTINTNPYYEINELGDIRTARTKRPLKTFADKDGYLFAHLWNQDTKGYDNKRVHRLVLENFIGMPKDNRTEVHHKDENRQNNFVENLCWVTRKENDSYVEHPVNSGSYQPVRVRQLDLHGNIIAEFSSISEASRLTNCQISKISNVCNGKRHTTGGYKWQKVEGSTTNCSVKSHEMEDSGKPDEDIV